MKTIKDFSIFWNDSLFLMIFKILNESQKNNVRDCVIIVVSKSDFKSEDEVARVIDVIYDKPLMVIDGNIEILVQEKKNLRFGFYTYYV